MSDVIYRSKGRQLVVEPPDGSCRVRGTGLLNSIHYAHQLAGSKGVVQVLSLLNERDQALVGDLHRTHWYPFALHCRLLRAVDRELGNGDLSLLFALGKHSATRDFPSFFRPVMRIGRPGWIIELATRLWRLFHGEGRWQLDRTPQEIIAKLEGFDEADEAFCESFVGYVTAALELSGADEVETAHPVCRARGAPHCVFTVRWTADASLTAPAAQMSESIDDTLIGRRPRN